MDVEQVVLEVALGLAEFFLAGVDDLHRVCATALEDGYPELEFGFEFLARFGIGGIAQEDVLDGLAAGIHVLDTLDEALEQLETAELVEPAQAVLQQLSRIFYFLSLAQLRSLLKRLFFHFFVCHDSDNN